MSTAILKSQILSKVASLLDKFSDRLVRVASQTRQNTDAIASIQDQVRVKVGGLSGSISDAIGKAERAHQALIHHGENIDKIKKENDEREARQVIRDQSNVQSLVNLSASTQKGFDQVKGDVESLLRAIQRLNERTGQVESQNAILVGRVNAPQSVAVDAKMIAGVYDVTADLEARLRVVEDLTTPPSHYMGYKVRFRENKIIIDGQDFFPFQQNVVKLTEEPYGLVIDLQNGDQHLLCGGPTQATMFINLFKKA